MFSKLYRYWTRIYCTSGCDHQGAVLFTVTVGDTTSDGGVNRGSCWPGQAAGAPRNNIINNNNQEKSYFISYLSCDCGRGAAAGRIPRLFAETKARDRAASFRCPPRLQSISGTPATATDNTQLLHTTVAVGCEMLQNSQFDFQLMRCGWREAAPVPDNDLRCVAAAAAWMLASNTCCIS